MEGTRTKSRRFACKVDDIDNGESMTIEGETPVALFRTEDGEFYATSDTCTHEKWSLGDDGDIEGDEVICPLHMARFDVRTGEPLCFPATVALDTFEVQIDDGNVYVLI
ncbi:non-heme iron oxygenase ferredoxin subunit [Haloechinothrix salitolerans]|uniref:Non-heme iron oxygenase ferredoxin subunit n=1 Tax=Haloechinothrix salitolerans TaxID=926830 RepID=A0ABW2BXW2_9PSEU